jgi:CheY-like chemotaxis protein
VPDHPEPPPDAFLSYTRIDDQFFGGAITSLRKLLELGVKVVTGERDFDIFQDVDGIGVGQQWQTILDQVIEGTRFLLPIVTPLFFNSPGCRDELQKFLAHEKTLGRDDLILPIYYVTAPVLEKPDLLAKDPLATEIAARQRYDWRAQADLAIDDPKIRTAVRNLAEKIATAMARTAPPGLDANIAAEVFRDGKIKILGNKILRDKNLADEILGDKLSAPSPLPTETTRDSAFRAASVAVKNQEPEKASLGAPRTILWVDDKPDNNIYERRAMEAYNIRVELARSTGEALAKLRNARFDAIISDMGRPQDPRAGYTLLQAVRDSGDATPYFIFSAQQRPDEAARRMAQGSTNRSEELITEVLACLDKPAASQAGPSPS